MDVLDDIPRYLNRFPIDIGKNSKAKYLEYHIANYLNEIYILYQRMGTYWKRVVRMYGNKKEDLALSNHIEEVLKFFEKIITTRGKHVHERRYNDDDLKRLVLFEMTSEMIRNNLEFEKYVVRDQANRIKRKWIRTIAKNKRELGIMLDAYFGFLKVIVFDKNNKIIFPDKLLKEKRT